VKIVVKFVDPAEDPITLFHTLRLHPLDGKATKGPVVAEVPDESVFVSPSVMMEEALKKDAAWGERVLPHHLLGDLIVLEGDCPDEAEMKVLKEAVQNCDEKTHMLKSRFDILHEESIKLRRELDQLIQSQSAIYSSEPVKIWRPEDFRHVPMMGAHDSASSKKKKATVDLAAGIEPKRTGGPGRKKKVKRGGPGAKKKNV
jgi:hypothetical protein